MRDWKGALLVLIVGGSVGLLAEYILKPIAPSWVLTVVGVVIGVVVGVASVVIIRGD
jgi:hypothetical protein